MKYEIHLLSDWHCGSGLSAGAESDAEVLKDKNKLPYIPGKTVKGLLKDALLEMPDNHAPREIVNQLFGWEEKKKNEEGKERIVRTHPGSTFFSNAKLPEKEQEEILPKMADFLYRNMTSTSIDEKGVAKSQTLRTMEVCLPIILKGEIDGIKNDEEKALFEKAMKWVRHLGVNRNRGLGRCQFKID